MRGARMNREGTGMTMGADAPSSTSPILTDLISRVRAAAEADDFGPEQVRALLTGALSRGDD